MIDSTTISLFQTAVRNCGGVPKNGKCKGGIKVHTLMRSDQDIPCLVRFSAKNANDSTYLKEVYIPKGSVIVFDRGYRDFKTLNRLGGEGITWITRLVSAYAIEIIGENKLQDDNTCILSDETVIIGYTKKKNRVKSRLIRYKSEDRSEVVEFLTNNLELPALSIASLYKKRWQIEMLYKRMKQNYPLKYFLGDNENAIKIQIWCSLIADLLLKIIKKASARKWSFSNLAAMFRLHLMTYIDINKFLKSPEKALLQMLKSTKDAPNNQLRLIT